MMDKTELLFHMMEHPEKYDDEQWQEILDDEQCRELYTTMSATRGALDAERYDRQADDTQLEWERLIAQHPHAGSSSRPVWRRVAAAIAVTVIAVGIVVAAVHTRGFGLLHENHSTDTGIQQVPATATIDVSGDVTKDQEEMATLQEEAHLYDDVPLGQIIDDMAARYNIQEVEWQSEEAKSLRLYYRWEPSYSIDKVVDMLNSFQTFTIKHMDNTLIISDITNDND